MMSKILCALAMLVLAPAALAHQAVVLSNAQGAAQTGQAFFTHYRDQCYAVMPTHVAQQPGAHALLREGRQQLFGEFTAALDLADDISISNVAGIALNDCGYSASSVARGVDRHVQDNGLAVLRSINGDATVAQMAVAIVDNDGAALLRVKPVDEKARIQKGLSGSALIAGGAIVGMLVSVDARSGVGKVVRQDVLMSKVDAYLAQGSRVADNAGQKPGASGLKVLAWNSPASGAGHHVANLVAGDDAGHWSTVVKNWPVTLDFSARNGASAWAGVFLDGQGVPVDELPDTVEVLLGQAGGSHGWNSVITVAPVFNDGIATIRFVPRRGQVLRLSMFKAAGVKDTLSLRRVEAIHP